MKKAEQYLEDIKEKYHIGTAWQVTKPYLLEVIKTAQIDAIEETCRRCAESVKFCTESFVDKDGLWDIRETNEIDLNSVYEVANKMKEEINGKITN